MTAQRARVGVAGWGLSLVLAVGGCAPAAAPTPGPAPVPPPGSAPISAPAPSPASAPGEQKRFGLRPPEALGAVQRGQGREALAFYAREAARLEGAERPMDAAHAHNAAAFIAPRLGEYQRGIVAGTRALD
ncbi:MAG: hypothetical protein HYS36_05545, partial [Candidatus Rokubacteria bacterium]|nr:hypothetical protein [Candidatus Rokubacteria bacterium]